MMTTPNPKDNRFKVGQIYKIVDHRAGPDSTKRGYSVVIDQVSPRGRKGWFWDPTGTGLRLCTKHWKLKLMAEAPEPKMAPVDDDKARADRAEAALVKVAEAFRRYTNYRCNGTPLSHHKGCGDVPLLGGTRQACTCGYSDLHNTLAEARNGRP